MNRAHEHVYENWLTKKFINRYALLILKVICSKKNFKTEHTLSFIYRLD